MGPLPSEEQLAARIAQLDHRALKVAVETGPWVSAEVSGPEVDVDTLFPQSRPREHSTAAPQASTTLRLWA